VRGIRGKLKIDFGQGAPHQTEIRERLPRLTSTLAESRTLEQSYGTGSPNQRKVVLARGLFWAFFSDGKDLAFRTSLDGNRWNPMVGTKIKTGRTAESVSIWHDNNTDEIHYSRQRHGDRVLELGRGNLNSNGSVSWHDVPLLIETKFNGQFPGTFICTSARNEIWAGTTTLDGEGHRHTEVWKSDGPSAELTYDVNFGPKTAIRPPVILPTDGGVQLIYGRTHQSDILFITSTRDGKEWASPVSPTGKFCLGGAAVLGKRLYYCGPSEGTCRFFVFENDTKTMENDLVLEPSNVIQATMATDGDGRLVAIYTSKGAGCAIFYRLSTDLGETWDERKTLVEGESITGFSLTSSKDIRNGTIGVSWTSGVRSPFKVKFAKIEV
jgi:hypothetical protein